MNPVTQSYFGSECAFSHLMGNFMAEMFLGYFRPAFKKKTTFKFDLLKHSMIQLDVSILKNAWQ